MKKTVFFLLILGLIGYSVYLVAAPHYNYFAFKSDVGELMRISIGNPKQITGKIMNLAEKYDIPIKKEDINLRLQKRYEVTLSWKETVDFFTIYQKTFEFYIDTSEGR
jgi:hypothetical protein